MAITTGHFYSALSDSDTILLCTDSAGAEFCRLPDMAQIKFAADPVAQFTDLQSIGLSAGALPTCTFNGENAVVQEGYSTDASVPNVKVVMIRPSTGVERDHAFCVARSQIGNVNPPGSV